MDKKEICSGIRYFIEYNCNILKHQPGYKWIGFSGNFMFDDDEWQEVIEVIERHLETKVQVAMLSKQTTQYRIAESIITLFDEWRGKPFKNKIFFEFTDALSRKMDWIIENTDEKLLLDRIFSNYDKVKEEEKRKLEVELIKNFGF